MHIDELCSRFGYSRRTIESLVYRGLITGPTKRGRYATYPRQTVADLIAYKALIHNNTSMVEVAELCQSQGITIDQYRQQREDAIRFHGLQGVA